MRLANLLAHELVRPLVDALAAGGLDAGDYEGHFGVFGSGVGSL